MPLPTRLRLYNSTGTTLVTEVTFSGVTPGTQSAAQTFRLVNDDSSGEVEPATDPFATFLQRDTVTDEPRLRGLRAVDERWFELEATGVSSAAVDQPPTGIVAVGRGRILSLSEIPSGGWVEIKARYHPPMSAPEGTVRAVLAAEANMAGVAIEQGHSESDRDGVIAGIGDDLHSEIVIGGTITASGTPDEFLNFPDLAWVYEGLEFVELEHQEEMTNLDGSSVALGANEGYWARISLGTAINFTKSDKFALVNQSTDDVPDVPAGEIDGGYVVVTDALAIDSADITSRIFAGRFEPTASGLNLTQGAGRARVDNALVRRHARELIACPASETVSVWLLPNGDRQISIDGEPPVPNALLLYSFDTDGTDIDLTTLVDHRETIGPRCVPVELRWAGTLTDTAKAWGIWPLGVPGYIRLPRGLIFRWHSDGSGNTAGIVKCGLKINGTTVFTSVGTEDRRPSIEHDTAVKLSTAGLPEVVLIPAYALFEAELDVTEAFDGTAPSGASLVIMGAPL